MWGLVFLPFTRGLTINLGFPLKIYEVLFPVAIFLYLFDGHYRMSSVAKTVFSLSIMFASIGSVSIFLSDKYVTSALDITYRGGKIVDGIMRVVYFLFNSATLIVAADMAANRPRKMLLYWSMGLTSAVAYHIYCFIAILVGFTPYLLPGLERHQIGEFAGMPVPRSGTFEEGNFAGLYYLCSLALAIYSNQRVPVLLSTVGIILTLSTSVFISSALFIVLYLVLRSGRSITSFTQGAIAVTLCVIIYNSIDFSKKFGQDAGSSAYVRLNESLTGWKMFVANPIIGVGIGGYGYHFRYYEWDPLLSLFAEAPKPIPNNIYIEILSETGSIGFLIFVIAGVKWARYLWGSGRNLIPIYACGIGMAVGFIAYPTYNVSYIWVFLGLSIGLGTSKRVRRVGI